MDIIICRHKENCIEEEIDLLKIIYFTRRLFCLLFFYYYFLKNYYIIMIYQKKKSVYLLNFTFIKFKFKYLANKS